MFKIILVIYMPNIKSSINFGMVYIPITYESLLKNNDINFHMLDKKTMSRIRYKKVSEASGDREILQKDIVKGYEYEDNKFVIMENKDFEKIKTEKDKSITIEKFVDIEEIDPIYYDRPYKVYAKGAEHAFSLLAQAMENKKKVGIAKTVIGQKETLVILRSKNNELYLNTLFFSDSLKDEETSQKKANFSKQELQMAETLIDTMSGKFNPQDYKDEYQEKLKQAINKKIAGKKITKTKEVKNKKITDLMEALTESIKENKKGRKKL